MSCAARHSATAAEAAPCFEPEPGVSRFAIQALKQTTAKIDRAPGQLPLLTCYQFPFLCGANWEMETKMQRQEKYDPLQVHLESVGLERIAMTFDNVERVIGSNLPASARKHQAWRGNDPSRNAVACAWLEAGYKTESVSIEREILTFRRDAAVGRPLRSGSERTAIETHPVIGCMSGTATISSGTDLTKPSLPEWEAGTMKQDNCQR